MVRRGQGFVVRAPPSVLLLVKCSADGEGYPPEDTEFAVARLESERGIDWNAETAATRRSLARAFDQLTSRAGAGEHGVGTTALKGICALVCAPRGQANGPPSAMRQMAGRFDWLPRLDSNQ